MPYIKKNLRGAVDTYIDALAHELANHPDDLDGMLEYSIYKLILMLYPLKFNSMNRAVGILMTSMQCLYWHVIGPYETLKRSQNGIIPGEPIITNPIEILTAKKEK